MTSRNFKRVLGPSFVEGVFVDRPHYTTNWNGNLLLIIDMQDFLEEGLKQDLIENIEQEIKVARTNKTLIIFLELRGLGSTLRNFLELTCNYPLTQRIIKPRASGYYPLKCFLRKLGVEAIDSIRVCGVFTGNCVFETVRDLCTHPLLSTQKIEVLANCCAASTEREHTEALKQISKLKTELSHVDIEICDD